MDDDRERVHRVAVEQHVELDEVGRAVLEELVVERRIATGDRLQLVVEVEDDLGEREFPAERSEEHTSELQSQSNLVCRLLLEKKKTTQSEHDPHTIAATDHH